MFVCMYLFEKYLLCHNHYFVAESWESCHCTGEGFPPPEAGRPDFAIGYCGGLLPHHVPALCPDMQGRAYVPCPPKMYKYVVYVVCMYVCSLTPSE